MKELPATLVAKWVRSTYNGAMSTVHDLEHFGLSEKEAAVYAAALELGPATADQLSKHSGIKRSTTYVQIESLQGMGLMSNYEEGKKTFFSPESPQNLERVLDRQQKELELKQSELKKLLPDLIGQFEGAGERPVVRFFQGKQGLLSLRKEILESAGTELRVIFSIDDLSRVFTQQERDQYSEVRSKKQIKLKAIYTRVEGPLEKITNPLSTMKFMPRDRLPIETDIVIYNNKVSLTSLKEPLSAVLIENTSIYNSFAALFEALWDGYK